MKKHLALAALALFAVACADPAGPNRTLVPNGVSLTVTTNQIDFQNGGSYPAGIDDGYVVLCKTGDAAGEFTFDVSVNDAVATQVTRTLGEGGGTDCGTGPVFTSILDGNTSFDKVEITEVDQDNWDLVGIDIVQHVSQFIFNGGNGGYPVGSLADDDGTNTPGQATAFVNGDMARTVTFTNDFTAPPDEGCTYTKGWYQNKNGAPTVVAVDGLTADEARAIFAATPGNPGDVTWVGKNNLLNLYQQLLAAMLNMGAADGPDAVEQAILDAQAGTDATGLHITTTLTQTQISTLTGILAGFNEGEVEGWPHCGDEIAVTN